MPIRLNDEQCLLWIKDPSVSPFINIKYKNTWISSLENKYIEHKVRRNILSEENIKNPRSFLNKIKRKCFHNSAIRQQIVDKIKEYQINGTLRLYTLNDKFKNSYKMKNKLYTLNDKIENIEYTTPPFTHEECERWLSNHLENPRPNETTESAVKVYDEIKVCDPTYIELIYTTLQYGMSISSILNKIPHSNNDTTLYNNVNNIIENILYRLEFMKEIDDYFLNHNVESFDDKLKISSSITSRRKAAAKTAKIANNPFGVSSTTSNSLNPNEKRQLRDIILEKKEEEKSIAIYQYNKGLAKKNDGKDRAKSRQYNKSFAKKKDNKKSASHLEIDNTRKDIFITFKGFLIDLEDAVRNGSLIKTILKNVPNQDDNFNVVKNDIRNYFYKKGYNDTYINRVLKENNYDTVQGIIRNFINNMFIQLIDPSTDKLPKELEIGVLSYTNKQTYLKTFYECDLYEIILDKLHSFILPYRSVILVKQTYTYFNYLTEDTIVKTIVEKRTYDNRELISTGHYFQNFYYKILYTRSDNKPKIKQLPLGRGLLMGEELTMKIIELNITPYLDQYSNPENLTITTDTTDRSFTYEECKNWVILPIFNPQTFKEILIDSPIYNTLLLTSYQYDTNLIPRMITSRGYNILRALKHVIDDIQLKKKKILEEKNVIPSKIGLKWKNAGAKQPKKGIEIIDKKLKTAFLKSTNQDGEMSFYVSFSEEDFAKFGVTDITKNSYIELSTYYIQAIDNKNKTANNAGLRWKIINNERYKEGIKRNGVEIISKKFKNAFLKLASKGNVLPTHVSFSKEDLKNLGITTTIAKNRYIKFTYYYIPVFEKSESDIKIKSINYGLSKKRDPTFVAYEYYTFADCLRWARQPNKDPVKQQMIITDSKEYNTIFEQALVYDYNIMPINITEKGKRFMKVILKIINKNLTIAEKKKLAMSRGKDIADINSLVCNTINNIYDNEGKKYKMFKNLMIGKCEQYNKEPFMCIMDIRNAFEDHFYPEDDRKEYKINYYQESALASLLNFYENYKNNIYNEEYRDIFIKDFNKFRVYIYEIDEELNEIQKDAIDAGGPKREFFTKLFEELFSDNEHPTRPFACPPDIIGNKYYINPNFKPDANFLKVIAACNKKIPNIIQFNNKERDYEYIYYVIGKLLCLTVYNEEIGLSMQLSEYILAGFINQPNEFDYYDILYFYLKEYENAIPLLNMINKDKIDEIEDSYLSFNILYNISKTKGSSSDLLAGEKIKIDNCIKFLLQQANHVVTKNYLVKDDINSTKSMKIRYESLFKGFSDEIRKFLYKKKVTIEQLSSLITNEQLTEAILHELVNKIEVEIPEYNNNYNKIIIDPVEKVNKENEMKKHISNMIIIRRSGVSVKDHLIFIKKLLQYWTALNYFNRKAKYKIIYKYGQGIDVMRLPEAHTCFNAIDVYGFPNNTNPEEKDTFLYEKFKLAVEATEMELR